MKNIFIILFALIVSISAKAQDELKVKSFLPSVNDLTARTDVRKDKEGMPCALVKVQIADKDVAFECGNIASMIIGDVSYHTNEYWVYMVAGTVGAKHLKVKHPNYPTIDIVFSDYGFSTLEALTTYTLIIKKTGGMTFSKLNKFYADAFFQAGGLMGPGVSIGAHVHAVNAEFEFVKGVVKSDDVFWYDQSKLLTHTNYSALSGNVKLGYGFQFGTKFSATPQLGFGLVKSLSAGDNPGKNANAAYALLGCRGTFVFAKHFQVVIAPYYNFAIKKSSSFKEISNVQSSVNKWVNGFNVKVGLSVFL